MLTQPEAVYQVIINVLLDNEIDFEDEQKTPAKSLITPTMKASIRMIIRNGLLSGEIYVPEQVKKSYDTPDKMMYYAMEIVGKSLRDDVRLNGGIYRHPESTEVKHDFEMEHFCRRLREAKATGQKLSVIALTRCIEKRALELKAERKQKAVIALDEEMIAQLPPNIRKMLGV